MQKLIKIKGLSKYKIIIFPLLRVAHKLLLQNRPEEHYGQRAQSDNALSCEQVQERFAVQFGVGVVPRGLCHFSRIN